MLVPRGNCSFYKKTLLSYYNGSNLTIVTNGRDDDMGYPSCGNTSLSIGDAMMVLVSYEDGQWLWDHTLESEVALYTSPPNDALILPSLVVVWLVAMFTLLTGSIRAQWSAEFLLYGLLWRKGEVSLEEQNQKKGKWWHSCLIFGFLLVAMVSFLLLLYFFWSVMIYFVVVMFTLASTTSVFSLVSPFVALIPFMSTWRIPDHPIVKKIPILKHRPDPRFFITLAAILCITVWWAVERNSSYSWILLLVLGYSIIVTIYRSYRRIVLKLWIFTAVLVAFLLYDVFFVYLTRFMTPDGTSVMEKIITGFESGEMNDCEMLPLAFKIPKFLKTELTSICAEHIGCLQGYVLLGFGDVALPGLLVSYCLYVDLIYHTKRRVKVYFMVASIAYGVGLLITFIVLELARSGQPALLFLVPSTLIPTLITAVAHRELKTLWYGIESGDGNSKPVSFKDLAEREDAEEETELEEFEEHQSRKGTKMAAEESDTDVEVYAQPPQSDKTNGNEDGEPTFDDEDDSEHKQLLPASTTDVC